MATQRQIEANRRNAQKSTGPRTPEGKQNSRWNALRHGLTSAHTVLPHEDPAEYHRIRAELIRTWQPANAQELMLVDQLVNGYWRMQRAMRLETAMFDQHVQALKSKYGFDTAPRDNDDEAIAVSMCDEENETGYQLWFRYDARAQSTYFRTLAQLRQIQNDRFRRERLTMAAAPAPASEPEPMASFGTPQTQCAGAGQDASPAPSETHAVPPVRLASFGTPPTNRRPPASLALPHASHPTLTRNRDT
jgi:hypothetical protein